MRIWAVQKRVFTLNFKLVALIFKLTILSAREIKILSRVRVRIRVRVRVTMRARVRQRPRKRPKTKAKDKTQKT